MLKIHIKQKRIGNYHTPNSYYILSGSVQIGEIIYKKQNNIFIIAYLEIYPEYRHQHYGYQIINHILSNYKIKCIVCETLETSKGFWNKCIKKFNGQRKNISLCDNCSSSFVIPKHEISNEEMYDLLETAYEIS